MGTFLNAVKNLINSLTAKTSSTASTADMVQLHDANGNPNGKISLADLASVLGGRMNLISSGSFNFDDYTRENDYRAFIGRTAYTNATGSRPIDNNEEYGIFYNIHVPSSSNYTLQIFIRLRASLGIYVRKYNASWESWKSVTLV